MPVTDPAPDVWNDTLLQNPHEVSDKRTRVQKMFAAIAPSYDLNNRLHSFGMDQWWRRKAVKLAKLGPTDTVVDVACGTGDLAIRFRDRLVSMIDWEKHKAPHVIGIDFTFEMLPLARRKGWIPFELPAREDISGCTVDCISWLNADAQALH